jgi:hypothetical protein
LNNLLLAFVLLLSPLYFVSAALASSGTNETVIYKNGDEPYETPYSQWAGDWWNYWMGIPNKQHPTLSYDPATCGVNQKGPVWFLPDVVLDPAANEASKQISCDVPQGKSILLPISTTACWYGDPEHNFPDKLNPTPKHDASLSQCVTNVDNTDVLSVSIDGKNVPTPDRMKTDFFNITVGEDFTTGPLGGIKGGKSRALADGYFLFLSPLTPGQHNLVFNVQDRVTDISQPITTRQGNYTLSVK